MVAAKGMAGMAPEQANQLHLPLEGRARYCRLGLRAALAACDRDSCHVLRIGSPNECPWLNGMGDKDGGAHHA